MQNFLDRNFLCVPGVKNIDLFPITKYSYNFCFWNRFSIFVEQMYQTF